MKRIYQNLLILILISGSSAQAGRIFLGVDLGKVKQLKPDDLIEALQALPMPLSVRLAIGGILIGRKILPKIKADLPTPAPTATDVREASLFDDLPLEAKRANLLLLLSQYTRNSSAEGFARTVKMTVDISRSQSPYDFLTIIGNILDNEATLQCFSPEARERAVTALADMLVNLLERRPTMISLYQLTRHPNPQVAKAANGKILDRWTHISKRELVNDMSELISLRTTDSELVDALFARAENRSGGFSVNLKIVRGFKEVSTFLPQYMEMKKNVDDMVPKIADLASTASVEMKARLVPVRAKLGTAWRRFCENNLSPKTGETSAPVLELEDAPPAADRNAGSPAVPPADKT